MLISTLAAYVTALGGRLRVVAEFPGRPSVLIQGIGALADERPAGKVAGARKRLAA